MSDKTAILNALPAKISAIVDAPEGSVDDKLLRVCETIDADLTDYDWVGFYMVDPNAERELVLGPYVGEATDHIRIPFGRGICGQAAETLETFVVDDVNAASNYLACSIHVKSEIVVPLMKGDVLLGELDIDSHTVAAFGEHDQKIMEELCDIISRLF